MNLKRRFVKARKIKEVGMARALQMVGLTLNRAQHRQAIVLDIKEQPQRRGVAKTAGIREENATTGQSP